MNDADVAMTGTMAKGVAVRMSPSEGHFAKFGRFASA